MTDTDLGNNPEEALSLVANRTRFAIVEALWDGATDDETPLSFSALRKRVGVRDSGKFNYHLSKLTPKFVRNQDNGYDLTHAGRQIVGAVVSGTYTDADVTAGPQTVADCPSCGDEIEAAYESGQIVVECESCALTATDGMPAPPVLVAHHDTSSFSTVASSRVRVSTVTANEGICELCGGPTDATPLPFSDVEIEFDPEHGHVGMVHRCRACGLDLCSAIGLSVMYHPAVVGLFHDYGIDVRNIPGWEFDWVNNLTATVESEAPPRVVVAIEHETERVRFRLDGNCEVLEYERESV